MNDPKTPQLRPANENPWYCLATLHGEQPIDGHDEELVGKNCTTWNQWITGGLNEQQRRTLEAMFTQRAASLPVPDPATIPDFSQTQFDRSVNFSLGFQFPRGADFRSATFAKDANFAGVFFNGNADYRSATFSGEAIFDRSGFHAGVDFRSATFSKNGNFITATLIDPNFHLATFLGPANFRAARFFGTRRADFDTARFADIADFGAAEFNIEADFASAIFAKSANFRSVKFSSNVDFSEATFSSTIYFVNATFATNTVFADARFKAQVPDFRGATMHEATEWHGVAWPKPPSKRDDAQAQVYAYERLKQEMERLKKHEDEQHFFRRELRARRGLVPVLSGGWLLNFAYQSSSAYGLSIARPILWLFAVFLGGTAIFSRAPLFCGAPMPTKLAVKLSFANIMVFLPISREIMTTPNMTPCLSNTTVAVSAAQSLLGVVLLFLLGLSLRNRFRMK